MVSKTPVVSVCIPTWNRSGLIAQTIESVLAQSWSDFELLIVDNMSTDNTEQVVKQFNDPRIMFMKHDKPVLISENWNRCLSYSRGKYIAILPDDDLMEPDNLKEKVAFLEKFPQVGLVHSRFHAIDQFGHLIKSDIGKFGLADQHADLIWPSREALERLIKDNVIHESSTMIRRTCWATVGGFRKEVRFLMDWEYWMRIAASFDIGFVAKPLIRWRSHPQSETSLYFIVDGKPTINRLTNRLWALQLVDEYSQSREHALQKLIREQLGQIIYDTGGEILEATHANREVRRDVLKTCWHYPRLLFDGRVLVVLVKSLLPTWAIAALRRIRGTPVESLVSR